MNTEKALKMLEKHTSKHSDNKYQHSIINSEGSLRTPEFTLLTAVKYLSRYVAVKGEKLGQVEDLLKAAHFILFEIQCRLETDTNQSTPMFDQCRPEPYNVKGMHTSEAGMPKCYTLEDYVETYRKAPQDGYWLKHSALSELNKLTRLMMDEIEKANGAA
jgi:hypothetical protein